MMLLRGGSRCRGRSHRARHPVAVTKMATMRAGLMGFTTSEVGDLVIEAAS